MGNIKENIAIQIFNYNPFRVSFNTNIASHMLATCEEYSNPTSDYVTFAELVHNHSNSTAIRSGLIRFSKEQEKEIYEALQIADWKNILRNEEIEDIILNPTKNGLQKIVDVKDASVFDRIVAIYQGLINSGEHDVSNRVTNIIDIRKDEFRKGNVISKIQLKAKDDNLAKANDDVSAIKEQNESLQAQLKEMQEMMAKLMASNKNVSQAESKTTSGKKGKSDAK